jgi:hypothetical protein
MKPASVLVASFSFSSIALALLPAPASAQPAKPLIQLHASTVHVGTQLADQDLFVAADGTATGQLVTADPVTGQGWVLSAKTARASAAQLAALQAALGKAQVGQQAGGCKILSLVADDGVAELRWYGRGLRKNTISVQIVSGDDGADICPPQLQQLFQAIEAFAGAVLGQGGVP